MVPNRAIVFDLDDTLYLEREYVFSGFDAVARYVADSQGPDRETVFSSLWGGFEEGVRGDNFDRVIGRFGLSETVEELVGVYRHHDPTLSLLPDAKQALAHLENFSLSLGLITDGEATKQQNKISGLNLSEYMDYLYISGSLEGDSEKPSTKMFDQFLGESGVEPASATYVGDNASKDFIGPHRLGMDSIWIRRPFSQYADIEPTRQIEQPNHTITNLRQLQQLVADPSQ